MYFDLFYYDLETNQLGYFRNRSLFILTKKNYFQPVLIIQRSKTPL